MSVPKCYRQWTTVLYPESCDPMWRSILDEEHLQYVVSPLHDRDTNPDGEIKKPHWHLALIFDGKKSYDQIKILCNKIGSVEPKNVMSLRGLVRYFAHLDNPEKAQYDISDIECHNGIDLDDCLRKTVTERHQIVRYILNYIQEKDITEYWTLLIMLDEDHPDWLDTLFEAYTMVITAALNSRRNMRRQHLI